MKISRNAAWSFALFPLWHDAVIGVRGLIFYGYYAVLPVLFLGFYFEDRKWIAVAPESIWNPQGSPELGQHLPEAGATR